MAIAYAEKGEVLVGVVHNPFENKIYTAIKGQGSYIHVLDKDGEVENVSKLKCVNYSPCIMPACGAFYDERSFDCFCNFIKLLYKWRESKDLSLDLRRLGSGALNIVQIGEGRFHFFFETPRPWDVAASVLIAKEAGAVVAHYLPKEKNIPLDMDPYGIFVRTPFIYKELGELFYQAFLPFGQERYPDLNNTELEKLFFETRWNRDVRA